MSITFTSETTDEELRRTILPMIGKDPLTKGMSGWIAKRIQALSEIPTDVSDVAKLPYGDWPLTFAERIALIESKNHIGRFMT